jgi:uncharacterized protein
MNIDKDILDILACPETKMPLSVASASLVSELNSQIEDKTLKNRAGELITQKIDSGLLRQDGKVLYIIRDEIPMLLIDEAVML